MWPIPASYSRFMLFNKFPHLARSCCPASQTSVSSLPIDTCIALVAFTRQGVYEDWRKDADILFSDRRITLFRVGIHMRLVPVESWSV